MGQRRHDTSGDLDTMLAALPAPRVSLQLREAVLREVDRAAHGEEALVLPRAPVSSLWAPALLVASLCLFVFALVGSISMGQRHGVERARAWPEAASTHARVVRFLAPQVGQAGAVPVLVGERTRAGLQRTVAALAAAEAYASQAQAEGSPAIPAPPAEVWLAAWDRIPLDGLLLGPRAVAQPLHLSRR